MTDNRQDEPKPSHWAPGQLTEASSLPHATDMKEQGGAGDGIVHSSNGIPFRETEERGYGERALQDSHPTSKENGINGEMPSADSETAAVEDTTNLPPSPPPSPASEQMGMVEEGKALLLNWSLENLKIIHYAKCTLHRSNSKTYIYYDLMVLLLHTYKLLFTHIYCIYTISISMLYTAFHLYTLQLGIIK